MNAKLFEILDEKRKAYLIFLQDEPNLGNVFIDFGYRFTTDSNKIEGSLLNLRDTFLLIQKGEIYGFKKLSDIRETISHFKVYSLLLNNKEEISLELILNWHRLLFKETKSHAGKFRSLNVKINGSEAKFPEYEKIQSLMEELIEWYNIEKKKGNISLLACLFKFKFVNIHPFADGNGRMSRLLMNYILHKNESQMLNIEFKDRKDYYNALECSNLQNNENIFVTWFLNYYILNDYFEFYYKKEEIN